MTNLIREKAANYGVKALTDVELLQLQQPRTKVDFETFVTTKESHYIIELAERIKRHRDAMFFNIDKISSSRDIKAYIDFYIGLHHSDVEQFWIILLSRANKPLKHLHMNSGLTSACVVDKQKIYRALLDTPRCETFIITHNHPSGNNQPSQMDIQLTKEIKQGAGLLSFMLLDHIIIAGDNYYSFADEGAL
jgi:DNA repair protein RadC